MTSILPLEPADQSQTTWRLPVVMLPIGVVTMPGPGAPVAPWNDQDIDMGSSPFIAMQDSWAKSPLSTTSRPNVRGAKRGDTASSRD